MAIKTKNGVFEVSNDIGNWGISGTDPVYTANQAYNSVISEGQNYGSYLGKQSEYFTSSDTWSGISDSTQYSNVKDALDTAADNYVNQKIQKLKNLWETPTKISLKTILDEAAPYAMDFGTACKLMAQKIPKLIVNLAGLDADIGTISNLSDLESAAGDSLLSLRDDFLNSTFNDSNVQQSIASLRVMEIFGQGLETVSTTITTIQNILKEVEPLIPYVEILVESCFSLDWKISMTSRFGNITKLSEDSIANSMKLTDRLLMRALYDAKKYLFSITITVPSIVATSLNTLSVRDTIASYDGLSDFGKKVQQIYNTINNDDFFSLSTRALTWQSSLDKYLNTAQAIVDKPGTAINNTISKVTAGTDLDKFTITSDFVMTFMDNVVNRARAKARIWTPEDKDAITKNSITSTQDTVSSNTYAEYIVGSALNMKELGYFSKDADLVEDKTSPIVMQYSITASLNPSSSDYSWQENLITPTSELPYLWIRYKYFRRDGMQTDFSQAYQVAKYEGNSRVLADCSIYMQMFSFVGDVDSSERNTTVHKQIDSQTDTSLWKDASSGEMYIYNNAIGTNSIAIWGYVAIKYVQGGRSPESSVEYLIKKETKLTSMDLDTIRIVSGEILEGIR